MYESIKIKIADGVAPPDLLNSILGDQWQGKVNS